MTVLPKKQYNSFIVNHIFIWTSFWALMFTIAVHFMFDMPFYVGVSLPIYGVSYMMVLIVAVIVLCNDSPKPVPYTTKIRIINKDNKFYLQNYFKFKWWSVIELSDLDAEGAMAKNKYRELYEEELRKMKSNNELKGKNGVVYSGRI